MRQSTNAKPDDVIRLLSDICRLAGLKITRQRTQVLCELAHARYGPTVDKIHQRLQAGSPTVSRETVRRTLAALERCGVVQQSGADDPAPRAKGGNALSGRKSLSRAGAAGGKSG